MANLTSHRVDRQNLANRQDRTEIPTSGRSLENATRLISEAAHDLRSPLTAVRESVRLVHDGELGSINREQQSLLGDAIDQCECIEHLVGEMLTLDRLRGGPPRVERRWISVSDVRQKIERTLRPWTLPRGISVVWKGTHDPGLRIYADLSSLQRLIVNLAVNAIRVSPDGGRVLIETMIVQNGQAIRWNIVDRGAGISEPLMRELAARQMSSSGGEGLGLMISRQLAAIHFSKLSIRSRVGWGTEISFLTPARDANALATCWSQWRKEFVTAAAVQPSGRLAIIENGDTRVRPPRHSRFRTTPAFSIELGLDNHRPRFDHQFRLGTVTIGAAMPLEAADQFDSLVQKQLTLFEMAYRVQHRRWVWILDADERSVADRIDAVIAAAGNEIRNLRVRWSPTKTLALDAHSTAALISDLLIRKSLIDSLPLQLHADDEVRLGTAPITLSNQAVRRLEREIERLRQRDAAI